MRPATVMVVSIKKCSNVHPVVMGRVPPPIRIRIASRAKKKLMVVKIVANCPINLVGSPSVDSRSRSTTRRRKTRYKVRNCSFLKPSGHAWIKSAISLETASESCSTAS